MPRGIAVPRDNVHALRKGEIVVIPETFHQVRRALQRRIHRLHRVALRHHERLALMGGEAPPVDKHAVGAGFRHFTGRFHLRPVGVAVAPERCPPRLIEVFQRSIALFQPLAEFFLTQRAVAVAGKLVGQVPEDDRRMMRIPLRQRRVHLPHFAAVNRAGQAVIVPSAKMVALIVLIHAQDFGVLLRHPRRTRARRRCQNDVDAAAPQPVDDFVQPREVVHAVLRLQPRPRENRNRHTVHMCLMHQLDVLFQNLRMIQPLVRVIVAAVQENREARRRGRCFCHRADSSKSLLIASHHSATGNTKLFRPNGGESRFLPSSRYCYTQSTTGYCS